MKHTMNQNESFLAQLDRAGKIFRSEIAGHKHNCFKYEDIGV